jgi:hypothetical protein
MCSHPRLTPLLPLAQHTPQQPIDKNRLCSISTGQCRGHALVQLTSKLPSQEDPTRASLLALLDRAQQPPSDRSTIPLDGSRPSSCDPSGSNVGLVFAPHGYTVAKGKPRHMIGLASTVRRTNDETRYVPAKGAVDTLPSLTQQQQKTYIKIRSKYIFF